MRAPGPAQRTRDPRSIARQGPRARTGAFWLSLSKGAVVSSALALAAIGVAAPLELRLLPGERWWDGLSVDGPEMPYGADTRLSVDLRGIEGGNQAQPLLLSNRGRFVWSEKPFRYEFEQGMLRISEPHGPIEQGRAGDSLREAFRHVAARYFPAAGRTPAPMMFSHPQYNTWIELMYDQNQADVLKYARAIKVNGYPAGVLMIDDNWQEDYGNWRFHPRRFPDPKAMMDELHALGFKVMLWVCPFVSADSQIFRDLEAKRWVLMEKTDATAGATPHAAVIRWWNGNSACLDLTHPDASGWFKAQLDALVREFGVDGFKFDAGDAEFYTGDIASHVPVLPNEHTEAFARIGLAYPFNEYRAAWKTAGQPLAQRVRDKAHEWKDLRALIPSILAQGLMGYAFTCPDMIGGGEFTSFLNGATVDEELVVRSAEVHALMPMMQFSVAPWRVLTPQNNAICRAMAELHLRQADTILALARASARSGEPIVRPLCWQWPDAGYEPITDQFMLGDDILVAPVVEKAARRRRVVFPPGTWRGDDGSTVRGPVTREIEAPLARLPWFHRVASE